MDQSSVPIGSPDSIRDFDASGVLTAWACLVFLLPARFVVPGLGAAGRPAGLFGIAMFALWAAVTAVPNVRTRRSMLRWPILAWVIAYGVSYLSGYGRGLNSVEALGSDRAMLNMISSLGVILLVSECLPSREAIDRLAKRVTYLAAVVAFVGIVQFVFKFDPYSKLRIPGLVLNNDIAGLTARGSAGFVRARGSTQHPIEFAVVLAQALPFALHYVIHEPVRILRNRRLAVVGLIGVGSLLAVSRSAVVAVVASAAVMFWAWSPRLRLRAGGLAMIGLAGVYVAIPGLLGTLRSLFTNWNSDVSISGRTEDYEIISVYIRDRPWFGRGVGTFNPNDYILLDNAYLHELAESGIIGTLAIIALLVTAMWLARRAMATHPSERTRHLGAAVLASVFAASLSAGTFDFFFFRTATAILMMSVGLAAAVGRVYHDDAVNEWSPGGVLRPADQVGVEHLSWLSRLVSEPAPAGGRTVHRSARVRSSPPNETEPIEP